VNTTNSQQPTTKKIVNYEITLIHVPSLEYVRTLLLFPGSRGAKQYFRFPNPPHAEGTSTARREYRSRNQNFRQEREKTSRQVTLKLIEQDLIENISLNFPVRRSYGQRRTESASVANGSLLLMIRVSFHHAVL